MNYCVPKYMNYTKLYEKNCNKVDNPYLLFHRYLEYDEYIRNVKKNKNEKNPNYLKCFRHISIIECMMNKSNKIYNPNKNISDIIKNMKNYETKEIHIKQDCNMVIGLGQVSVAETSMTLHHIYGIPYMPGQALKGITRSFIINEYFEGNEEQAKKDNDFIDIFGIEGKNNELGKVGKIIFFDSYPEGKINCKMDIMNNHHSEYYLGKRKLDDRENPIPIKFMTINDTKFNINIAIKIKENTSLRGTLLGKLDSKNILDATVECVKQALVYSGIGAKTAVGYGYFSICK